MVTISNSEISVTVAKRGAEIQSINRDGVEYMWSKDPAFWASCAPIMFPMCGGLKKGRYELDGKSYEMPKHGFAKISDFEVEAQSDTSVTFITVEEMARDHAGLPHGGRVIRTGRTGLDREHTQAVSYSLRLDSNPEFTAAALVAFARAVMRMKVRGRTGCVTVLDVAPADLSLLSGEELRAHLL